jgi:hypothetical protein
MTEHGKPALTAPPPPERKKIPVWKLECLGLKTPRPVRARHPLREGLQMRIAHQKRGAENRINNRHKNANAPFLC